MQKSKTIICASILTTICFIMFMCFFLYHKHSEWVYENHADTPYVYIDDSPYLHGIGVTEEENFFYNQGICKTQR